MTKSKKISLLVSSDEYSKTPKGSYVTIYDGDEVLLGEYKVSSQSKTKKKTYLIVGDDLEKFTKGMRILISNKPRWEEESESSGSLFEGKNTMVLLGYGFTVSSGDGPALGLAYLLHSSLHLGLDIQAGSAQLEELEGGDGFIAKDLKMSGRLILARARYFPFQNSFHVSGTFGHRQMNSSYTAYSEELESEFTGDLETSSLVLGFTVGNLWQFGSFIVGGDWFGYHLPIIYSASSSTSTEGETQEEHDDLAHKNQEGAEQISKTAHYQFAVLFIGYLF
jgi:hypothetical protein